MQLILDLVTKKALALNALLVVSPMYEHKMHEGSLVKRAYSIYISKSKAGEQYLDSLGGANATSQEGNFYWGNYYILDEQNEKEGKCLRMDKYYRITTPQDLIELRPYELNLVNDDYPERGYYRLYVESLWDITYVQVASEGTYRLLSPTSWPLERYIKFERNLDLEKLQEMGVVYELPEQLYVTESELRVQKHYLEVERMSLEDMELPHWKDRRKEWRGSTREKIAVKKIRKAENKIKELEKKISIIDEELGNLASYVV